MKKILVMSLAAVIALSMLIGCGAPAAPAASTTPAPAAPAASAAPAPSAAGDADPNVGQDADRPIFGSLTDEEIMIGESMMDLRNPFFIAVREGSEAYANAKGYPIQYASAESVAEKQVSDIESLISAGVNILDCRVVDTTAVKDKLAEARAAGIAINTYPFMAEADTIVGYNNYDQGILLAEDACAWMQEKYDGKCKVALMTQPTVENLMQRVTGFKEVLARECPEAEIVAEVEAYQPDTALEAAENILQKDPDTKVFLCVNDSGSMGVYEAVMTHDEANADGYWVGGIDGTDEVFNLIKTGGPLRCSIASKYFVQENTWMLLDNLIAAAKGEPFVYVVPMEVLAVNQSNVEEYTARPINYETLPNVYDAYKDFNWDPV